MATPQKSRKQYILLLDGKEEKKRFRELIEDEIELMRDNYPELRVSGEFPHYILKFLLESSKDPSQKVKLVVGLEQYYPFQAPTISLECAKSATVHIMNESRVASLRHDIQECITPCVESGVGSLMVIVRCVMDALEEVELLPPPAVAASALAPGKSPTLTPIPLKQKEAIGLSILAGHLLKKCCYLKYPESVEEGEATFQQLLSYLVSEKEIIPYGNRLMPWRDDRVLKAYRKEMEQCPVEATLLQWLWTVPTAASTTCAITNGRYKEEFIEQQRLGAGGFAQVVVCRKKLDGRQYAVKKIVMRKEKTDEVVQEVKALANLNHKNIVRYYDAWVEDGYSEELAQYIDEESEEEEEEDSEDDDNDDDSESDNWESSSSSVKYKSSCASSATTTLKPHALLPNYQTLYLQMELCSSITLYDLLNDPFKKFTHVFHSADGVKIASTILRQLLSVIAHTHHEGIAHRDLKPANILFDNTINDAWQYDSTVIRVVDFGLAKRLPDAKRVDNYQKAISCVTIGEESISPVQAHPFPHIPNADSFSGGTVLYCAPEQCAGRTCTSKVDEFSIGMIALEMWLTIENKDMREKPAIMEEMWSNENAKLPAWFVAKHPGVARIIESLTFHDVRRRLTCEEVLRDASLPGDPPELIKALETVDRYGSRMVASVLQRINRQEYQCRGLSTETVASNRRFSSDCWSEFAHVSEMIGHLHGFASVPFLSAHVPMSQRLQRSQEYIVNSSGWSFIFSTFPHYAIASYLASLPTTPGHRHNPFMNFYCKDRPFLTFITPCASADVQHSELYAEPMYCFLHLLCCLKTSGVVRITVSHASWMHASSSHNIIDSSPSLSFRDDSPSLSSFPPVHPSMPSGSHNSNMLAPHILYDVKDDKSVQNVLEKVKDDRWQERNIYQKTEQLEHFLVGLMTAVQLFEKYLYRSLAVKVVIDPQFVPSEEVVPRDVLFSDGVLVQCDMLAEEEEMTEKGKTISFGCTVDHSTTELGCISSTGKPSDGIHVAPSDSATAFVLSVDVLSFLTVAGTSPLRLPLSVSVTDGVGFKPSFSALDNAVTLWMSNIRACLACEGSEQKKDFMRGIRYLLVGEHRLLEVRTAKQLKKKMLTGMAFLDLALEDAKAEEEALRKEMKQKAHLRSEAKKREHRENGEGENEENGEPHDGSGTNENNWKGRGKKRRETKKERRRDKVGHHRSASKE